MSENDGPAVIYKEANPYETLLTLAKSRYSCRAFEARPVARNDIERILEIARTAPSDCNTQPASIFIISGLALEGLRSEIYEAAATGIERTSDIPPIVAYTGVFQERRRECGWALYNAVGVERGDRDGSGRQALENFRFFGAPHLAVVTSHKDLAERGLFDTGIYLGHLLLGAQAMGVAAVAQGSIAHYADVIRKYAPISTDLRVICGVSFGYEWKDHSANSFRTGRMELDETAVFVD
ncbi:nitroreductase [Rhizobium leguminosarum bv. trifolii]|uniref:nitroreductase n=1 Tax=Rhizobium leguminosarum TaxID=384 RepID=UPI000E3B5188|nr:nitroreductase [Rhizobium leguminosarum]RFB87157.1 nitroreductase [Rhizobium leguminosarum bv. trifolii]